MKKIVIILITLFFAMSCSNQCDKNASCSKSDTKKSCCKKKACSKDDKTKCTKKKACSKSKKSCAKSKELSQNNSEKSEMHHKMNLPDDKRISLGVSGMKAKHQLINMRDHVDAVQTILVYLASDNYEKASKVATERLGMNKQMKMMCSGFGNDEFTQLGFDFHDSADKMSEVFKTKDKNKSLEALSLTMSYCVACHSKFKQ